MRSIERMLEPSASAPITAIFLSVLRMFAIANLLASGITVIQQLQIVKCFCVTLTLHSMSSKRSKQNRRHTRSKEVRQAPAESRRMLGRLLAICTMLGVAIALLTLLPRLSISDNSPIDANDPMSARFRIVNDGFVPLFSVKSFFRVGVLPNVHFVAPGWETPVLWPTRGFDLYPAKVLTSSSPPECGEISIVVQYIPFGIPIRRERIFRYIGQLGPDKKLYWMLQDSDVTAAPCFLKAN